IPREEREGPKFHPVAEGLPGTAEVLREQTQCPIACRGKTEISDEPAPGPVIVIVARLVELFPGRRHLSAGELSNPRTNGLRLRGEADEQMIGFFPAVRR